MSGLSTIYICVQSDVALVCRQSQTLVHLRQILKNFIIEMRIGNLDRQLASLAGPIFIETLLVMMLGGVDTFMLSRYSDNSVAAVGVVNQIMNLVFLLFEVISLGTSILCTDTV